MGYLPRALYRLYAVPNFAHSLHGGYPLGKSFAPSVAGRFQFRGERIVNLLALGYIVEHALARLSGIAAQTRYGLGYSLYIYIVEIVVLEYNPAHKKHKIQYLQ